MVDLHDHAVVALGGRVDLGILDDLGTGVSGDLVVVLADLDGRGAQVADLGEVGVADGAVGLLDGGDDAEVPLALCWPGMSGQFSESSWVQESGAWSLK